MRVAVIGCGAIATKAYLPTLTSLSNVELTAVADVNENLARRIAKKYKVPNYSKNYEDILRDDSIDLVCVCTPPHSHAPIVLDALHAGKHVLVEKPLALSVKDGKIMVETAKKVNRKLSIAHEYRYFPSMKRIKEEVQGGALGTITSVIGVGHIHIPLAWTKSTWLYEDDVGVLYDFAPHLIDAILWLVNSDVEEVVAFGYRFPTNMPCLTQVEVMMKFKNSTIGLADVSWLTGTTMFTLNIYGTGGRLFEDVFHDFFIEAHGTLTPLSELKSSLRKTLKSVRRVLSGVLFKGGLAFYKELLFDLIKSIESDDKVPISGEEALNVLAISRSAKVSIEQKRIVNIKEILEN